MFNDFWLFLRPLSCIGSSGRPVGRIYALCCLNLSSWCRTMTKTFVKELHRTLGIKGGVHDIQIKELHEAI